MRVSALVGLNMRVLAFEAVPKLPRVRDKATGVYGCKKGEFGIWLALQVDGKTQAHSLCLTGVSRLSAKVPGSGNVRGRWRRARTSLRQALRTGIR